MSTLIRILLSGAVAFVFFGALGLMWSVLPTGWALLATISWVFMAITALVEMEP